MCSCVRLNLKNLFYFVLSLVVWQSTRRGVLVSWLFHTDKSSLNNKFHFIIAHPPRFFFGLFVFFFLFLPSLVKVFQNEEEKFSKTHTLQQHKQTHTHRYSRERERKTPHERRQREGEKMTTTTRRRRRRKAVG